MGKGSAPRKFDKKRDKAYKDNKFWDTVKKPTKPKGKTT